MDPLNDFEALTKAFSGFGVDEDSMVSILGKWHSEHLESFRKRTPKFFLEDECLFERWDDHHIACLTKEFLLFKILDSAMKANASKKEKTLTRVIVTRTDVDMKDIVKEYNKQYGTPQAKKIEDVALGNYKDFLVTLVQRALAKGSE